MVKEIKNIDPLGQIKCYDIILTNFPNYKIIYIDESKFNIKMGLKIIFEDEDFTFTSLDYNILLYFILSIKAISELYT